MTSAAPLVLMIAIGVAGVALGGLVTWAWLSPRNENRPLPTLWSISPRPIFNASERRLYRQLKDAFPQHLVMPKLPLVRLCQPDDRNQVDYWYGLLGSTHATFTICSSNGKALLAIDLESRRARSRRNLEIKEAVLKACQIRYFSIAADGMPTVAALRLLLPQPAAEAPPTASRTDAAPAANGAAGDLPTPPTVNGPPAERAGRWQDSSVFMDSFFAPDSRLDFPNDGDPAHALPDAMMNADQLAEIGGVVVEDSAEEATEETSATGAMGR